MQVAKFVEDLGLDDLVVERTGCFGLFPPEQSKFTAQHLIKSAGTTEEAEFLDACREMRQRPECDAITTGCGYESRLHSRQNE